LMADPLVIFADASQIWPPAFKEQIDESLRHLS
jgi:hypothetical protein